MGNDFSHRDVYDGNAIDQVQRMSNSLNEWATDNKEQITRELNKISEPLSKLDDIRGDLQLIIIALNNMDQTLRREMAPKVVHTFLKNYLSQEKGLTKRQMGNLLLLGANWEMFNAVIMGDIKNEHGTTGIIFREFGNVVKELEVKKNR